MSIGKIFALTLFAAIALSSAAWAQGGGGGGGGGAAGGASGAGGAAGTTGGAPFGVVVQAVVEPPPPPPPPPPPTGTWPNAATTGVRSGVVLAPPRGDMTTTQNGQVISGLQINGRLTIAHNDVTVRDCKIDATGDFYGIYSGYDNSITGLTVEYCDITGPQYGIGGAGTFRFNNISKVENSIIFWGPSLFEENYVHGLFYNTADPHYDGVQMDGGSGVKNIIIRHNNIVNPHGQTSAIMIDNYFGPIDNVLVENNRLIGGAYTIFTDGRFNSNILSNIRFVNNRLGKGQWGYIAQWGDVRNGVWTGNVDDVTGVPVVQGRRRAQSR